MAVDFRELRLKITKVFLPGTAIRTYDFFSGRSEQMTKAMSGVQQPGRHVILFGERGVGKTSLAKVLVDTLQNDGYRTMETQTINCDPSDDFTTLWRKVFRVMPYSEQDGRVIYLDQLLPTDEVFPDDVRYCLARFKEPSLIALDEVDQLKDPDAKNLLAATIKNLSDHSSNATLMLIGVADTADELIEEHRSIIRAMIPVRMPRMSDLEIIDIVNRGVSLLGMTIDDMATAVVVMFARGFPYYAHSFGLYAGIKAIDSERTDISAADVYGAAADVTLNAFDIHTAYSRAIMSPQSSSRHDMALLACAFAIQDEHGFFSAAALKHPLSILLERAIDIPRYNHYLEEFCEEKRGRVLQVIGSKGKKRYRFADALMLPYIIINAFGTGKLDMIQWQRVMSREVSPDDTIH